MALFGKKGTKVEKVAPKAAVKGTKQPKQPKQPKVPKPKVPADVYTLLLGLAALFLVAAAAILGWDYYSYQTAGVIPLNWAR